MKNVKRKLELIEKIKDNVECHIWEVFRKYKTINKVLFSDPEFWEFGGDSITFRGVDGCRGCYDPFSLKIPLEYFTEPSTSFENLINKIQTDSEQKEIERRKATERSDLAKLAQLKAKYEGLEG